MLLGVGALGIAAEVLTGGAATPWVVQALAYTAAASGAATTVNGASEFVEGISDYNLVEDGVFGGNSSAYQTYTQTSAELANISATLRGVYQIGMNIPAKQLGKPVGKTVNEGGKTTVPDKAKDIANQVKAKNGTVP